MVNCSCIKTDGKPCTRSSSTKPKDNPKFCWQHQNCQLKTEKQAKQKAEKQAQQKAEKQAKQASDKLEEPPITQKSEMDEIEKELNSKYYNPEFANIGTGFIGKFTSVSKRGLFAQFLVDNGYTVSELKKLPVDWEKSIDPGSVKFNQLLKKFDNYVNTVEENEKQLQSELYDPKFAKTGDKQELAHLLAINNYIAEYLAIIPKNWRKAHDPISVDFQKALKDYDYLDHDPDNLWEWDYDYGEKYW